MSNKERSQIPPEFILPAGMHPTTKQYQLLLNSYMTLHLQLDDASTTIYSLECLLVTEKKLRESTKQLEKMYRRLPPGCFKIPDRRQ